MGLLKRAISVLETSLHYKEANRNNGEQNKIKGDTNIETFSSLSRFVVEAQLLEKAAQDS